MGFNLFLNRLDSTRVDSSRTARSLNSARGNQEPLESFRTSMSTARVQTALAALGAEKQALLAKLQAIDAALESDEKKRASIPRGSGKYTKK